MAKREIAEIGFDPMTYGLWAHFSNHCATLLLLQRGTGCTDVNIYSLFFPTWARFFQPSGRFIITLPRMVVKLIRAFHLPIYPLPTNPPKPPRPKAPPPPSPPFSGGSCVILQFFPCASGRVRTENLEKLIRGLYH